VRDLRRVAAQFGLGEPVEVVPLPGGHPDVVKLTTARGAFVVKPAGRAVEVELSALAAQVLNDAGICQAQPLRTVGGSLVGDSGHTVQEFLTGRITLAPTPAQTSAVMRHIAAYHAALEPVRAPASLRAADTVWTRVASAQYLVDALPGLVRRSGLPAEGHPAITAALREIAIWLPQLRRLPRQLVHGDIAPDNVLMNGDEVSAIIDFTPFDEPVLFAVSTALYWYHIYGHDQLDLDGIGASLAELTRYRQWTAIEAALWPVMLAREALRRLATPLALAEETRTQLGNPTSQRYQAVLSVMHSWPDLQQLRPA
jgi:Ser/Thr protein kinase RdoA (MazF antagonist)